MTLASGGVLTELVADVVTLLLSADRIDLGEALGRLRISRLLDGTNRSAIGSLDRFIRIELKRWHSSASVSLGRTLVRVVAVVGRR